MDDRPYLIIPDLQIPFEHPKALEFFTYLKKHYRVPDENVYNVGDETDQYFGGMWKKDINAPMTAVGEITETCERMRGWYSAFPKMKIATSNHGTRWQRKFLEADIPEILMRRMRDVLQCPAGWVWQKRWLVRAKYPFLMEHGDRFGGQYPHIKAVETNAFSTVIGHHHSKGGIEYIRTFGAQDGCIDEAGFRAWGMCVGGFIDFEKYAFNYGRDARHKPFLGGPLVFNRGSTPFLIPFE